MIILSKVDHALRFTIRLFLFVLFLTLPDLYEFALAEETPGIDFFNACSGGDVDQITKALEEHPSWANAYTENGETCLHLTGIFGHSAVTKILLNKGADPNIRSTFEKGLRMHPLSWNVYGGHLANIELLLDAGADVNLDFDSMVSEGKAVTSLDVLLQLLKNEKGDERFAPIEKVLRKHGAKTMNEVLEEAEEL
jgi:ankyrin repeat protein